MAEGQTFCSIMFNIVHFAGDLSLTTKVCVPTSCLSVNSTFTRRLCRTLDYDSNGNTTLTSPAHANRTAEIVFEETAYR